MNFKSLYHVLSQKHDYFYKLSNHIKYMSKELICEEIKTQMLRNDKMTPWYPDIEDCTDDQIARLITKSSLTRTMVMNEKEFKETYYNRTLRSLWYSVVKPTLDTLGILEFSFSSESNIVKWDATLSEHLSSLVKGGYLTYADLDIKDISRRKAVTSDSYQTTSTSSYGFLISKSMYPEILIATEKDAVYDEIYNLAEYFGLSCISSKGQNSLGAMELILNAIKSRCRELGREFKTLKILTMTDYDPAGYYIADALKKQADAIKRNYGLPFLKVTIDRIGITPDQLDPEIVKANSYSPKIVNLEKWFELTGGINGEPKGLELDALTPAQRRAIFVSYIEAHIDLKDYQGFIASSYIQETVLAHMESRMDTVVERAIRRLEDDIIIRDDFSRQLIESAKEGRSYIDSDSFIDNQDEIIEAVIEIINDEFGEE